jgi:hypothetical protein
MGAHDEAIDGVTLEQYAGIAAALADELPLAAALAHEGLTKRVWKRADRAWKQRLAADGAAGPLFAAYERKHAEAEDWLGRSVAPLDEDVRAWLGFLRAYGTHGAPFELLTGAGLRLPDVARLQRRWSRRFAEDEQLGKQAAEIAAGDPGPMPAITVGTTELRPFPWSRGGAVRPPAAQAPVAEVEDALSAFPLDRYAALRAALAEQPPSRAETLARHGLDEARLSSLEAAWNPRLDADEACRRDYRRLFDHQRARLRSAASPAPAAPRFPPAPSAPAAPRFLPAPSAPPPAPLLPAPGAPPRAPLLPVPEAPRASLAGTSFALEIPSGPALPFVAGEAPAAVRAASSAPTPPARPALGGTALVVDAPRGRALPFPGAPEPARAPRALAGTALAVAVPSGPTLPFVAGEAPPAVDRAPAPRVAPAPGSLGGTALAVDVPRTPALPFGAAAAPSAPAPATAPPAGALRAGDKPAKANKLGELRSFELPRALPKPAEPAPPPPAPAPVPPFTLEQYASLCVELSAAPARVADTLTRYRLTAAEREALDRHFLDRFTREPSLRGAWQRACATYRDWLARASGR